MGQCAGMSPEVRQRHFSSKLGLSSIREISAYRSSGVCSRERQRLLAERDTEQAIRDVATNWNVGGQGMSGTGPAP